MLLPLKVETGGCASGRLGCVQCAVPRPCGEAASPRHEWWWFTRPAGLSLSERETVKPLKKT